MDAVSIESRFGNIYGERGRGHAADADAVRSGEPKHLAKALEKAHKMLSKRLAKLPESDPLHIWIKNTLDHVGARAEALKTEKLMTNQQMAKLNITKVLNHTAPLWEAYADSLHTIHVYLESKGL